VALHDTVYWLRRCTTDQGDGNPVSCSHGKRRPSEKRSLKRYRVWAVIPRASVEIQEMGGKRKEERKSTYAKSLPARRNLLTMETNGWRARPSHDKERKRKSKILPHLAEPKSGRKHEHTEKNGRPVFNEERDGTMADPVGHDWGRSAGLSEQRLQRSQQSYPGVRGRSCHYTETIFPPRKRTAIDRVGRTSGTAHEGQESNIDQALPPPGEGES